MQTTLRVYVETKSVRITKDAVRKLQKLVSQDTRVIAVTNPQDADLQFTVVHEGNQRCLRRLRSLSRLQQACDD